MGARNVDAIVVGGGPAGASTAFQLARRGLDVRVIERSRFPRSKPCAECLSPQASRILSDMSVLGELEPQGALLRGMEVRSPKGEWARGDYEAVPGFRGYRDRGLAIRRELLDSVLLRRAGEAGARIESAARVTDVLFDGRGGVDGVAILRSDGSRAEARAPIVIGADGLRSVVARRLGLSRAAAWPRRLSLVAHYRGVADVTEYVEMHVERDGFVGIADVGGGVTTVAAVFPASRAPEISRQRETFLAGWLSTKPHLAERFESAMLVDRIAAIGPFASHAKRAWFPGALLVGDAADFFDPFTGEGIYAALRGGELAADAVARALAGTSRGAIDALRDYDRARRREFGGKWWVERLIGIGVAAAPLANRAIHALASRKELADLLVGVTGDFVPPARVLTPSYLARLFLLPTPALDPRTASSWR